MKKVVVIFLLLGVLVGIGLFVASKSASKDKDEINLPPSTTPTVQPTKTVEAISIDGKMKLIMQARSQAEGVFSYTFSIFNGEEEYEIFTTMGKPNMFVVPQNSWSPDNEYVFLIDTATKPQQVYVFKASGESFNEGEDYLNVTKLFEQKKTENLLDQATGWDSRGLLHLRTQKQDKIKGPSYWFDVTLRSFIQLAAR